MTGAGSAQGGGVTAVVSPEPVDGDAPRGAGSARTTWVLTVCCVAQFMVILDLSIVNVALPSIQSSLSFSPTDLQWVVDAYAITFAGFLMLGGRAADHFGQRRTFVAALILFSLASLAGGTAWSRSLLIGARAIQGLAGALMAASSLAIITSSFPPGPARHRAIGLWGAMNGAGGATGVLLGGVLTQAFSWRWILLINPPIGAAAALVAVGVVANVRGSRDGKSFDLGGALTLTLGQMVLVYGIVTAGTHGWSSPRALIPIAIGIVLLAVFVVIEARFASAPLVPFRELTRPLQIANTIVLLFSAAIFPMWYLTSLYLQQVLGLSPLKAGLTFLPMALTIMVCARSAGKLVSRFGVRTVLGSGLLLFGCGLLLFTRIVPNGNAIAYVIVPGVLTATGIGFSIVPSTIAAVQGAREGQAGFASGLVNTSRQIGGGLGIALLITFATQYTTHLIGQNRPVPTALTDGFRLGYLLAAAFVIAAAIMTFALLPRRAAAAPERARPFLAVAGVVAAFVIVDFVAASFHPAPIGAYTTRGAYTFASAPDLHPPQLVADTPTVSARLSPGYIFLTSFYDLTVHPMVGQSGPLVLDNRLQPVWFKPVPLNRVAANLSQQTYRAQPVLAWWQGVVTDTGATTFGEDVVVDRHYRTLATLKGTGGWILTLHALTIHGNDAWVSANRNIPRDLSRYGGTYNGALIDSAVQEYDLRTGRLLFTWDALKHIPLSDSHAIPPTNGFPWDAYHVNAVDLLDNGDFVVSMRNTWAAYLVDGRTGQIKWTLGGKHSSFSFGPGAAFEWQHDVQVYPNGAVTLFDDHCCQISGAGTFLAASKPSRGVELKLDTQARRVTLVAQYTHGANFDSEYMGNTEPLANGNMFVGWGSQPYLSEYSRDGQLLLDAKFPHPDQSYRATLGSWVGLPTYPPAGAAVSKAGATTVFASWNGATEVASWRVLAGSGTSDLHAVASRARAGFETPIPVSGSYREFEVQALDARGHTLGTSGPFATR